LNSLAALGGPAATNVTTVVSLEEDKKQLLADDDELGAPIVDANDIVEKVVVN